MAPHDGAVPGDDTLEYSVELELGELSDELQEKAQRELGETTEQRTQSLIQLRNMISEKGDLCCRMDDEYLLRFLRARRFNVKRAYELLQNNLNFKASRPDLHENVWPQQLKFLGDDDIISVPPYKDQNGRRMIIYKVGNWSPSKCKITELFKASVVVQELALLERASTVLGSVVIFDLAGLSLTHVWHMTPAIAETMIEMLVKSSPLLIHALHVVNQPMVFHMIFALFKPLLNKHMQERIFMHGSDLSSLHRHISPKRLPKIYGGAHEEFSYRLWMDSIEKNSHVISELKRLGYNFEENESTQTSTKITAA